jgi:hypothetical protein
MDALTTCLAEIANLATRSMALPATVATSLDDFDNLNLDGVATASPSIPHKLGTPSPELPIKDNPLDKKLHVRAMLTNLGWDRMAESLHLPALTENGEWIYSCTDQAGINEAMVNMFTNIPEAITHSTDFLHREVDLPHHDPLVYALYTMSHYEVSTMQSTKLTGESKKHFCYFYLVPDSKALAKEPESVLTARSCTPAPT